MAEQDWADGAARTMMVFLNGEAIPEPDARGQSIVDDDFLILYNAARDAQPFVLPPSEWGDWWQTEVDTAPDLLEPVWYQAAADLVVEARSLIVLRHPRDPAEVPAPPIMVTATPKPSPGSAAERSRTRPSAQPRS